MTNNKAKAPRESQAVGESVGDISPREPIAPSVWSVYLGFYLHYTFKSCITCRKQKTSKSHAKRGHTALANFICRGHTGMMPLHMLDMPQRCQKLHKLYLTQFFCMRQHIVDTVKTCSELVS